MPAQAPAAGCGFHGKVRKDNCMRKRIAALALAAVMAFGLTACGGSDSSSTAASGDAGVSGEFTGTAQGMGEVTVTVTLTDGVITDCVVEGPDETEGIGAVVVANAPDEIVSGNKGAIDVVSGATITSDAVNEALAAALAAAGLDAADFTGEASSEAAEDRVIDTDIVVVGAGGAGMTAAITAAQAGKSVVILEKTSMVGGNSVRSTGGMNAAKTEWQDANEFTEDAGVEKTLATAAETYPDLADLVATVQAQYDAYKANPTGYFDSVELFILDTMVGGQDINNYDLVKTLAENSAPAIEWLSTIGADLHNVGSFGGASVKRIHRPVDADGKVVSVGSYVVPILQQACEDNGVQIIYNAPATEILMDNGAAVGVKADGYTVNAKSVVLATGGFGANLDMVAELKPELKGFVTTNAPGITGDGIKMAEAVGVPADAFASTMEKWNAAVAAGTDAEFGRTSFANPLDTAPYYAIKIAPGVHHTMGGVKINTSAQVLDTEDNVIPGLFAAGEVTGGIHGANRLGGNAVADFIVFGRISGQSAADYAK